MFSWLILLWLLINDLHTDSTLYMDNLLSYQISKVDIFHFHNRKYTGNNLNLMEIPPYIRINFSFLDRNVEFIMEQSKLNYSNTTLEIIGISNYSINDWQPPFYEHKIDEFNVLAMGMYFSHQNMFTGFITAGNITYYMEPAKYYFPEYVNDMESSLIIQLFDGIEPLNYPNHNYPNKANVYCEIEVVSDHTYYQLMHNDYKVTASRLYLFVKYADLILRNADLGPNIIRLSPKKITIYTKIKNPVLKLVPDIYGFLDEFGLRHQKYCLSFGICNRIFPKSSVIGLAYLNGICQGRKPEFENFPESQLNIGIITSSYKDGKLIPFPIALESFTHEIGHSFGSNHDPKYNFTCSSEDEIYLMHPSVARSGLKILRSFSPCSVQDMTYSIKNYGRCLKFNINSVCGNGIREDTEQCDCGNSEEMCQQIDPCCTPSGGNEEGCRFRISRGSECSPVENECCNDACAITKWKRLCFEDDDHCLSSFCTGQSEKCPLPQQSENGYSCMSNSKTCLNGVCNSTVCRDHNLTDCISSVFDFSCYISCIHPLTNKCVPAWHLGFLTSKKQKFIMLPNTQCYFASFFRCDRKGKCQNTRKRFHVWFIILIVILCVLFLLFLMVPIVDCIFKKKRLKRSADKVKLIGSIESAT